MVKREWRVVFSLLIQCFFFFFCNSRFHAQNTSDHMWYMLCVESTSDLSKWRGKIWRGRVRSARKFPSLQIQSNAKAKYTHTHIRARNIKCVRIWNEIEIESSSQHVRARVARLYYSFIFLLLLLLPHAPTKFFAHFCRTASELFEFFSLQKSRGFVANAMA